MKVSAGEGKAVIGVVDTYTENKPMRAGAFSYYKDLDVCKGK